MPKITEMFAFVTSDTDENDEGVLGVGTSQGLMPMVGADMSRVKSLIPIADKITEKTGKPYRIIKFSSMTDITEEVKNGK